MGLPESPAEFKRLNADVKQQTCNSDVMYIIVLMFHTQVRPIPPDELSHPVSDIPLLALML